MNWNKHSKIQNAHAYLSPSQNAWLKHDDETFISRYKSNLAKLRGTALHELAKHHIKLRIKMAKTNSTFNRYVNDAIGFRMKPEQVLYYSDNCFGTADAICFRDGTLRIHDLKTGTVPCKMDQLMVYAALFCLEYAIDPNDIIVELRIYQSDVIKVHNPSGDDIQNIMDIIVHKDEIINKLKEMEES